MWTSNPRQLPELTDDEVTLILTAARRKKGQDAYNIAYSKTVKGEKKYPAYTAKQFREFITDRGKARAIDRGWKNEFVIDKANENIAKLLCLYFTGDKRFEEQNPAYSLKKGIWLAGPTGVGKTVLMELCSLNPYTCFTKYDCQEVAEQYAQKDGGKAVLDYYISHGVPSDPQQAFGQTLVGRFFDDAGQENMARHFGNERNVIASVIEGKYRLGNYYLCHFTSNHTLDELNDVYGPRAQDRLHEMVNVLEFPAIAKSRRTSPENQTK